IRTDLSVDRSTNLLAAELVLMYQGQNLVFESAAAEPGWRLTKTKVEANQLNMVLEAVESAGLTVRQSRSLFSATFAASRAGPAYLEINASKIRIAVSDPETPSVVSELAANGQKISGQVAPQPVAIPTNVGGLNDNPDYSGHLPRPIPSQLIVGAHSAAFFFRYSTPALVTIHYGDSRLTHSVKMATRQKEAALVVESLPAGRRYFYRVEVETDNQTKILGSLGSFQTVQSGIGASVADLATLVVVGGQESQIYFFGRDAENRPVTDESVTVIADNRTVKIGPAKLRPDYRLLTATAAEPVTAVFSARSSDGKIVAVSESVLVGQQEATSTTKRAINHQLAWRLVALVASIALGLGWLLGRLTRSR
ncbi:MAG: hypothetical protein AAB499_01100, partial [Patescibacteria group bacterium]